MEERLRRSQGKLRARLWPKASEQRPKAQRKRTKQGDEVATVVQNVNLRLLLRDGERSGSPVSKGRVESSIGPTWRPSQPLMKPTLPGSAASELGRRAVEHPDLGFQAPAARIRPGLPERGLA